ncbi:MAG TPA: ABC transporter substrate-binding protein [Marmoricola sp.]|nr:ABC transporter substrate-binding protein [Marmoricola sp.]
MGVLVLGASACGGDGAGSSGNADEIVIGVAQPLSGPVAAQGTAVAEGAKIAAKEINDAGGVGGKSLKLVIEDDANDPATCVNIAQRFTTRVKPSAVMGGWGSSCTLAMQPVLERAQMPLLVETSSSDLVTSSTGDGQGNEWTFRLSPTSTMEATALKPVLEDMDIEKVFTLSVNNDFGLGAAQHYGDILTGLGADVVGGAKFEQTEQSFSTYVTQAKASGADTWIVTTDAGQIALLLKEARAQRADAKIITTGGSNSPIQVNQLAGGEATNNTFATMFFPVWDPSLAADPEGAQSFLDTWKKEGKDLGEATEGVRGYTGIKVLAAALENVDDPTDHEAVRDALAEVETPGAIYGNIKFEEWNDLINQNVPPVYLVETKNGELELIGTGEPPY